MSRVHYVTTQEMAEKRSMANVEVTLCNWLPFPDP